MQHTIGCGEEGAMGREKACPSLPLLTKQDILIQDDHTVQ